MAPTTPSSTTPETTNTPGNTTTTTAPTDKPAATTTPATTTPAPAPTTPAPAPTTSAPATKPAGTTPAATTPAPATTTPPATNKPAATTPAPAAATPPAPAPTTPAPAAAAATAPPAAAGAGVRVHLQRTFPGQGVISFGVPVPPGAVKTVASVRVSHNGAAVAANVKELLAEHGADGARVGVRSMLVQLPAGALGGDTGDVDVSWSGAGAAPGSQIVAFTDTSAASAETVATATRTISNGALVETGRTDRTLFTAREPRVLATFPDGYLASTGILGRQATASAIASGDLAGLSFMSDAARKFGAAAMNADSYALNPDAVVDPTTNAEGWLYDRCATFLTFYTHTADAKFLREAYRSCSYYAGKITLSGANTGIFTGKAEPDTKYSHLRGLYAYYALTGDESALAAGTAIASLWRDDQIFAGPYRAGHMRGPDRLWTERLLGTSLEGLYYGHRLTGDPAYLTAFKQELDTAYRHITGDAAALASINPGVGPFPPQSCFIHSAEQHTEGDASEPWCSIWMSELIIDPLLQYQAQTADARVDEIFVRLVRYLRDVGSQYMRGDVDGDTFLHPRACYDASAGGDTRRLVPLYGSGLDASGTRHNFGAYDDFEHCTDATALTAAGIRALVRQGKFGSAAASPVGPFASEGESFVALHHEFAACAKQTFAGDSRPNRDPSAWSAAQLAAGAGNPAGFIADNLIGYPRYPSAPQRKLSWWFNTSMLQFGLLSDAGVKVPNLTPGRIQPAGCGM